MTTPAACAATVAPGRMVYPERGIPYQVFADRTGKRLVAVDCLSLE